MPDQDGGRGGGRRVPGLKEECQRRTAGSGGKRRVSEKDGGCRRRTEGAGGGRSVPGQEGGTLRPLSASSFLGNVVGAGNGWVGGDVFRK